MTRLRVGGAPVIETETPGPCELCGACKETRPYGPNGEEVCFSCGMKDEEAMKRRFGAFLDGEPLRPVEVEQRE